MKSEASLDSKERIKYIHEILRVKIPLRDFYIRNYIACRKVLKSCPVNGLVVEIGSGGGFIKDIIPEVIATDLIAYDGLDRIVDAKNLPFDDESVRCFFLINTFHHIPSVEDFLSEAQRCLVDGGKIFLVDQHVGFISYFLLKYFHHESFDSKTLDWGFSSSGPLSDANGALSWIVFSRDLTKFKLTFPRLRLNSYTTHSPLWYWLSGGMKQWCLIPEGAESFIHRIDTWLLSLSKNFGSFVDIEIEKIKDVK